MREGPEKSFLLKLCWGINVDRLWSLDVVVKWAILVPFSGEEIFFSIFSNTNARNVNCGKWDILDMTNFSFVLRTRNFVCKDHS